MKWDWMSGNTGRIAYDQPSGRVFIVTLEENAYSTNQWLQVFDRTSRQSLRDLRIPATGNVGRLLILNNGLVVFNTRSGIFILGSPWLLPSEPYASLQLAQTASPSQPHANEEFALTMSITNLGPAPAQDLVLETRFPTNHEFLGASADAGSWQVHKRNPSLAAVDVFEWRRFGDLNPFANVGHRVFHQHIPVPGHDLEPGPPQRPHELCHSDSAR